LGIPNQTGWQPQGPPQPIYVSAPSTNETAIAALILVFVFFPLGIILGHIARGQIKRTRQGGRGLATAALIIGYLPFIVAIIVFVGAAILVAFGVK
jgi:peptidyl-prolyl cis-trans isomerase B (cyclophilin B)